MAGTVDDRVFRGKAYLDSLHEHYPELVAGTAVNTVDERLHTGFIRGWMYSAQLIGADAPDRFQSATKRSFSMKQNAWAGCTEPSIEAMRRVAASFCYRGLIHLKPPVDLVLYSNLIWELQPSTIIEFGALQGGSSLWLAHQMEHCGASAQVHSFELLTKCIHPSAAHPRLHFHQADLRDLTTLDPNLFAQLPHPWLVIDDAHENLDQLMRYIDKFLLSGDYYVLEDVLFDSTSDRVHDWVSLFDSLGLMVDTKYTDAFGYNVTCAPNGWLRKS